MTTSPRSTTRPCDRCGVRIQCRPDRPGRSGLCRDCKDADPLCFRPERHEVAA